MPTSKQRSFVDLQAEIATLQKKALEAREREVADVVGRIKQAIATYGLTAADLGLQPARGRRPATKPAATRKPTRKAASKAGKIAPKYRDDAGNTWTGRGMKPRWLAAALKAGRRIEEFAI